MLTAADVLRGPGGEFAGSRSQGGSKPAAKGHGARGKSVPARNAAAGPMYFDPRTGRGTGYGQRHGDKRVRGLQRALNKLGLLDGRGRPLAVDGKLGPLTTHAVMTAQKLLHLKPDGRVTPQLLAQITAMAKAKKAPGKPRKPKKTARSLMRSGRTHTHR